MIDKETVMLNTLNRIYVFKLIDCDFDPSGIKDVDPSTIKKHEALKNKASKQWYCQLDGGQLNGLLSTVTLPKVMTKDEAQDYIMKNEIKDDAENQSISVLLGQM